MLRVAARSCQKFINRIALGTTTPRAAALEAPAACEFRVRMRKLTVDSYAHRNEQAEATGSTRYLGAAVWAS
jgi:hypothetical protein